MEFHFTEKDYAKFSSSIKFRKNNTNQYKVYEPQVNASIRIMSKFYFNECRWVVLNAQMQSGKSGTFGNLPYCNSLQ